MPKRDLRMLSKAELESMDTMGLDGEFEFQCRKCGKCCTHIVDVVCTPEDLFRIAVYLHREPDELLGRYFEAAIYAGLPAIKLATGKTGSRCPFLLKKKCIVHDAKPMSCKVYPLARLYKDGQNIPGYIFQDVFCNNRDALPVKVRHWIGEFGYPEQTESGRIWTDISVRLCCSLQKYIQTHSQDEVEKVARLIFRHLYLEYNTMERFLPQLINNRNTLERELREEYSLEVVSLEEAQHWETMLGDAPAATKGADLR